LSIALLAYMRFGSGKLDMHNSFSPHAEVYISTYSFSDILFEYVHYQYIVCGVFLHVYIR
jgi:hypothetical protein